MHHSTTQRKSGLAILLTLFLFMACEQEEIRKEEIPVNEIAQGDKDLIRALGFDISDLKDDGEFYVVENDILLRKDRLADYKPAVPVVERDPTNGRAEQARVDALISLANQRNITVFVDGTIPTGGDDDWRTEVQQAIADINAVPNSRIRMQYVTSAPADITIRDDAGALNDGSWVWTGSSWAWTWTLAQAEWPLNGNAGFQVRINNNTDNNRVMTTGQKRHNIAHELGHCVGFRHTNWSGLGESTATGIVGTPNTGSNPDPNSVMNGGTALNSWAGFSSYDQIAFSSTYPAMRVTISGPTKGNNSGTYTWTASSSNGISPYTYTWLYSYDGINYNNSFGTGPSRTAQLPLDMDLYLQVTATASDGEVAIDDHFTMNLDAN